MVVSLKELLKIVCFPFLPPQSCRWRYCSNSWQSVSDSIVAGSLKSRFGTPCFLPHFFLLHSLDPLSAFTVQLPHTGWHSNGVGGSSGGSSGRSNGELSQCSVYQVLQLEIYHLLHIVLTLFLDHSRVHPEYVQSTIWQFCAAFK